MSAWDLLLHIRKIVSGWGVLFREPEMPVHKRKAAPEHHDAHVEFRVVHRASGRRFVVSVKEE